MTHYDTRLIFRTEVPGATPEELKAHEAAGKAWLAKLVAAKGAELNTSANAHAKANGHKAMTIVLLP